MRPDGFEMPWQVRHVRLWWAREGRRHAIASRGGHCECHGRDTRLPCQNVKWHRESAAKALGYARNARPRWLRTGIVPLVAVPYPGLCAC